MYFDLFPLLYTHFVYSSLPFSLKSVNVIPIDFITYFLPLCLEISKFGSFKSGFESKKPSLIISPKTLVLLIDLGLFESLVTTKSRSLWEGFTSASSLLKINWKLWLLSYFPFSICCLEREASTKFKTIAFAVENLKDS